jgi:hypothetical protein
MAMKWTPDRPVESGDYWFRSAKNKPPQAVTVQGDKVTFRSGKIKTISNVQGEWGGAVTSSDGPTREYSPSRPKTETWPKLIGKLLLGAIIGALLYEPYFTYVKNEKSPEIVENFGTSQHISITVFPIFRNWGLKPGHIENATFSPRELHLYPDDIKLNHCDQAAISLLSVFSGKTIICNFTATINHQNQMNKEVWFQVSYYGPGGHEIYTETYSAAVTFKSAEGKDGK